MALLSIRQEIVGRFKNMAGYLSDIMFHRKQAIVVSRLDPMDLVRAPLEYRANN